MSEGAYGFGIRLRGITWDDPRGWGPLDAVMKAFQASDAGSGISVSWDIQPLEGFESRPVADLAHDYDLLNLDHPQIGETAARGALRPVGEIANGFLGPSLKSYQWNAELWAVPVDAACQVAAHCPSRLSQLPRSYDDLLALGQCQSVAASLGGVHALMALLTLLKQHDAPLSGDPEADWPDPAPFAEAAQWLRRIAEHCIPESLDWNPLHLFAAMSRGHCDYAPFTFAYVSACKSGIHFAPVPSLDGSSSRGAVLGGTGIAVSAHSVNPEAALATARFMGSDHVQRSLWPSHGGQPALRAAWETLAPTDPFYRDLMPAVETAWIRPRYHGWNDRQLKAGNLVNAWLRQPGVAPRMLREQLQQLWRAHT